MSCECTQLNSSSIPSAYKLPPRLTNHFAPSSPQAPSGMFFAHNENLVPPYQVLVVSILAALS